MQQVTHSGDNEDDTFWDGMTGIASARAMESNRVTMDGVAAMRLQYGHGRYTGKAKRHV